MDREIRSLQKTKGASLWRSFDTTRIFFLSVLICSIYKPIFLLLQDNSLNQWFSNLSYKHPCSAHFVCLPCQTHLIQVLQSLLTSWWVESGVSDKGDIQNVQGRGACRTGLKTTGLNESLILENTHIGIISLANSALIAWLNGYMNAWSKERNVHHLLANT